MKMTMLILCLLFSVSAFAEMKCKAKFSSISCSGIEGAKRDAFCWKGNLKENKKMKICKTEKKKKHIKKAVK